MRWGQGGSDELGAGSLAPSVRGRKLPPYGKNALTLDRGQVTRHTKLDPIAPIGDHLDLAAGIPFHCHMHRFNKLIAEYPDLEGRVLPGVAALETTAQAAP